MSSQSNGDSRERLKYIVNHVFLPSQLPRSDDTKFQHELFGVVIEALKAFRSKIHAESREPIDDVLSGLSAAQGLHDPETCHVVEQKLIDRLADLEHPLPIHIRAQNAAILLSKTGDRIRIEEFELSATNLSVTSTKGRLVRKFPAFAVSIRERVFQQKQLQHMIAQTLSTLSHQTAPDLRPHLQTRSLVHEQVRDTTDPVMVSEFFMKLLQPIGQAEKVLTISKNTRDEALWSATTLPFRRSPMWLLIRVYLQLFFRRHSVGAKNNLYKEFMVFFLSRILDATMVVELESDLLHAMIAKVSRRLHKLRHQDKSSRFGNVQNAVLVALKSAQNILETRWAKVLKDDSPTVDFPALRKLNFVPNTFVSIPDLDAYISRMAEEHGTTSATPFAPTSELPNYKTDDLPKVVSGEFSDKAYTVANMQAFEDWVSTHLDSWIGTNAHHKDTCDRLLDMLVSYHTAASILYGRNPEAMSTLVLICFKIWTACDSVAVATCLLLGEYDLGVKTDTLQNLLLPSKDRMIMLDQIETYIANRFSSPTLNSTRLLYSTSDPASFAARYFDQSSTHKELMATIIAEANSAKRQKEIELRQLKKQLKDLQQRISSTKCESEGAEDSEDSEGDVITPTCSPNCQRCKDMKELEGLRFMPYEWPLPENDVQAKAVVLELQVPSFVASWRDATDYVLQSVLKSIRLGGSPKAIYPLKDDRHLAETHFVQARTSQRIGLLSSEDPMHLPRSNGKAIRDVPEADICVPNRLDYEYFDFPARKFARHGLQTSMEVPTTCTYELSTKHRALQKFMFRPFTAPDGVPVNTVFASQHECPAEMSLEEFKELSTLPLGHKIQWENIIVQLAAPAIDFKKADSALLISQCIHQAGPPSESHLRSSHRYLAEDSMALEVTRLLQGALNRIRDNWESSTSLSTFISIATRVLELNPSPEVRTSGLSFLDDARKVAYQWMNMLRLKSQVASGSEERTMLAIKSVEVALICAATFDLMRTLLRIVLGEDRNVTILVRCSMLTHEGRKSYQPASGTIENLLSMRFRRVLYKSKDLVARRHVGLHDAVRQSWAGYQAGTIWTIVSRSTPEWLATQTAPSHASPTFKCHLNVLTGELLVNSLPLGRLPKGYESQPLYPSLFGDSTVEVMPSLTAGMQFSTRKQYNGYAVDIGMRALQEENAAEMIVRASDDAATYETLPSHLLSAKYPTHFLEDFVHWYDLLNGCIQLRPLSAAWDASSSDIWTLAKPAGSSLWRMTKGTECLVGISTRTARDVSTPLGALSEPSGIHCVYDSADNRLHVELFNLRSKFILAKGSSELRSVEYPAMVVDENQSLGTLLGFQNKLLLKHNETGARKLILLDAALIYEKTKEHIKITMAKTGGKVPAYHVLDIDTMLNRLIDNGSLESKLLLAHLHALSSYCLPDPLTGRTGTEQALAILRSASVKSYAQLSASHIHRLGTIAKLTPGRSYYPARTQLLQTVAWDAKLGFLSQHNSFVIEVQAIFDHAERMKLMYPESEMKLPKLQHANFDLLKRDSIRTSTFRVAGYGAEAHSTTDDVEYAARDRSQDNPQAAHVFLLSNMIFNISDARQWPVVSPGYLWVAMKSLDKIYQLNARPDLTLLKYDRSFMYENRTFVLQHWPALHNKLNMAQHKYSLMVWLSTMAWMGSIDLLVLQCLALSVTSPIVLDADKPGPTTILRPIDGKEPNFAEAKLRLQPCLRALKHCPEATMVILADEAKKTFAKRKQAEHKQNRNNAVTRFAQALLDQWPTAAPDEPEIAPALNANIYIDFDSAMKVMTAYFKSCYDNMRFDRYLAGIETGILDYPERAATVPLFACGKAPKAVSAGGYISTSDAFGIRDPEVQPVSPQLQVSVTRDDQGSSTPRASRLEAVIESLNAPASKSKFASQYLAELRESLASMQAHSVLQHPHVTVTTSDIQQYRDLCASDVNAIYFAMVRAASTKCLSDIDQQKPRLSPMFFLEHLALKKLKWLSAGWKASLIQYGLALVSLQRAGRLLILAKQSTVSAELMEELLNRGHENWRPEDHPDTLLMEVESNITVRANQEHIAAEMRNPGTGKNTVCQMLMGQGKSSVIAPMVAAALANESQLVRLVVAKPQAKQMAQMLVSKLGGALDRRVYFMPISRNVKMTEADADTLQKMLSECMETGGVLLVQPEHILSLKLMGIESYATGNIELGRALIRTQNFFHSSARDIVDESDENFSVKFELIYTMGAQAPLEMSPARSLYIQVVLHLACSFAPDVMKKLPGSISIQHTSRGAFPKIRILRPEAEEELARLVAVHICEYGLDGFPIARHAPELRDAVRDYILTKKPTKSEIAAVEAGEFWTKAMSSTILLLRGILAGGVLGFAFRTKRWRVNYGLTTRTPPTKLAVPYKAKDSPSPRSEYAHAEVTIFLTCLSYYYGGLNDEDLYAALHHLMESDQADDEYQAWVKELDRLPTALRNLDGVNLKDESLCKMTLFPALRNAKAVIDFFLSRVVFPKEMREFPEKLASSGWDVGEARKRPTTGFSGTIDTRNLLPLGIEYLDLKTSQHTNALVLEYLLQPENSVMLMPANDSSGTSDADHLLRTVMRLDPAAQVILDVGAHIIEMSNLQVAKAWLMLHQGRKDGVVFCNDRDDLCVVDKRGHVEMLQTSSFLSRLDKCLVFLDEAHTRGIDLQLPRDFRAAVTLGIDLTKDRLVQACMRMRKLGQGQSVVFCVPGDIQTKIREASTPPLTEAIEVSHVLAWAIQETWQDLRRGMPMWALQGERYVRQQQLWDAVSDEGHASLSHAQAEKFLEPEAQTIEQRYRPGHSSILKSLRCLETSELVDHKRIVARCREFENGEVGTGPLQEEQERELSPEIEQERQVQKAPPAKAAEHDLHADVVAFWRTGILRPCSETQAYDVAYLTLADTKAADEIDVNLLARFDDLRATRDFACTIKTPSPTDKYDSYQRHVQWIVSKHDKPTRADRGIGTITNLLLISPFEANKLRDREDRNEVISIHVYKPRTQKLHPALDKLDFRTVPQRAYALHLPRRLAMTLNVFAGQLYLSSYNDYTEVCNLFGLAAVSLTEDMVRAGWTLAPDGFIRTDENGWRGGASRLRQSPVQFLKILLAGIRRHGMSISRTDMGKLLEGGLFQRSDFGEEESREEQVSQEDEQEEQTLFVS